MDEYLYAMLEQPYTFAAILAAMLLVYLPLGRKTSVGWLDPWMPQQFLSAAASATVVFLWWIDKINFGTMLYHLTATVVFFAVALYHTPTYRAHHRAKVRKSYWKVSAQHAGNLQLAVFIILLTSQLVMWSITGLPVLLQSRLDAAATGGGIGVLTRIASVFGTLAIFLTVMRIGQSKGNFTFGRDALILVFLLLIQVANGSKASIIFTVLFFITSDWLCRQVSRTYRPIVFSRKMIISSTLLATSLALVPIILDNILYTTDVAQGPIVQFATRAVLSGDSYLFFWGEGYIKDVMKTSPTLLLAADLLGTLRIIPREVIPVHPGIQLSRDLFPFSDAVRGPNMRLDLFGMLYGNWLAGLIFVAFAGVVFNFMRSSVFLMKSPATIMLSSHLFLNAPAVFIDPTLGEGVIFNALLFLPIIYIICKMTRPKKKRRPNPSHVPADPIANTLSIGNRLHHQRD